MSSTTLRPPSGSDSATLEGIQALRAVAAIAVVIHHALEEAMPLLAPDGAAVGGLLHTATLIGASGVDLFFVISGFIMLHTNWYRFGEEGAGRHFIIRRYVRIIPLYWVIVLFILAAYQFGFYRKLDVSAEAVVGTFLLMPVPHLILGVAWTLVFEMYFYYVFAAWLRCRRREIAILGTTGSLLAVLCIAQIASLPGPLGQYLSNPIILEFVFGMIVAYLFRHKKLRLVPIILISVPATLLMLWGTLRFGSPNTAGLEMWVRWAVWGLPSALAVASLLWVGPANTVLRRVMLNLGDASFAIYLSHALVMTTFARLLKNPGFANALDPLALVFLTVVFAVVLGWLVHVVAEKPMTRLSRRAAIYLPPNAVNLTVDRQ